MLKSAPHPISGLPIFVDHTGEERVLARLAPTPESNAKKMAMPTWSQAGMPVIPRGQWVEVNRDAVFDAARFCLNQKSHGSCVGFSAAMALMKSRVLRGATFQRLSGAYVYSWINGGQDNGAVITEALGALQQHGACLESTVDWNTIYRGQAAKGDAEAARFKLQDGIVISTFDELGSAIQLGFIPQFAVMVGNNYERFSSAGICGVDSGPGNHSVHVDGMSQINGQWVLRHMGSWGTSWGPSQNGRAFYTEEHFTSVGQQDAFVHRDIDLDPQDPNNPPAPK